MMSFLIAVVTSRYPIRNNQLRTSSNPRQQATINNGRVTIQPIQGRQNSMTTGLSRLYASGSGGASRKQRVIVCYNCKGEGHMSKQCTKPKRKRDAEWFKDKIALLANLSHYGSDNLAEALGFQNPCYLKRAQQLKPKLYDGSVIEKSDAIVIHDSDETLLLAEEMQPEEPNLSASTTIVEVPKELPKVSLVNSSLKKLKFHLASFDMSACMNVDVCESCVTIETEHQKDFIHKECYDILFQKFNTLEKHCISLEVDNQLKKEIFERNTSFSQESAPTFAELFEINDLKAQSQAKDTEKVLVITALKESLSKLKGKDVVNEAVPLHSIHPELLKIDVAPLALKLPFADADHAGCQDTRRSTSDFSKSRGIFINQSKYALESLKKYGFESCDPVDTPMVEKSKLDEDREGKAVDPSHYRGMIGTLLYLTASRPDLQFAICMCAWNSLLNRTMATTIEQQVVLDEALVPSTKRLRIGRRNFILPSDIQSKESTLQVVYDVLRSYPFFKAFLVTADVSKIYMQEF
nr:uncharacterized mitochondrial protein AtMg00810-like [Tanacetum cinerariifolium]